jgi:hypothetical protein
VPSLFLIAVPSKRPLRFDMRDPFLHALAHELPAAIAPALTDHFGIGTSFGSAIPVK